VQITVTSQMQSAISHLAHNVLKLAFTGGHRQDHNMSDKIPEY